MDNNFDENNPAMPEAENSQSGEPNGIDNGSAAPQPLAENTLNSNGQNSPNTPPPPQTPDPNAPQQQYGQPYAPPPNMSYGAYRGQGFYPPPQQSLQQTPPQSKPERKRFSGGCLWSLISVIILMLVIIMALSVKIAMTSAEDSGKKDAYKDISETQKAEHMVVELPVAEKPKLEDEYYADKETGLLTSVGVAKAILPSQVQIKVFGEIPYAPVSTGSGIILTENGYILTNAHVVDGAKRLSVKFYEDGESEAVVVGVDKKSDLAVVKVDKTGLVPAQIGRSSSLEIGEEVALAGAGGGFENTVTYGHITGLEREINTDYISSAAILCIQSDAALNPGNSGGALVNMYGQVVGVAVALMNHETYENIGFSISIDDAVPIAEDLIAQGYVSSRTKVGISYVSIGDAAGNEYGIPAGLCVMDVDPACDIAGAGLKPYDIITEIDGVRVFGAEEVSEALSEKLPGDVITISVFRKEITGEVKTFETQAKLSPDMSSVSGYYVNGETEDFSERDVIK